VQACWLGYLNTTGLEAIDYRITDARATPRGPLDTLHSEKLVRLPGSQWCYRPWAEAPDVAPPPSVASGHVTFAVFANAAKIGAPMLQVWSKLLALVPNSRLLVAGAALASVPTELEKRFMRQGIPAERLQIIPAKPFAEYLALHGSADIILDTHPYSGGTTTCHALWMGVPVVTLTGATATSRGGASLLHAVGLQDLIAGSEQEYLAIAARLAGDPARLASMRKGLRKRMRSSPLMDEAGFVRNLEKAYRAMWLAWCKSAKSSRHAPPTTR
jgi:predicted O-linked N-acetylglucosamine transferase (SPINDLY family)